MEKSEVLAQIRAIGVIPVLRMLSSSDVLDMAEALHSADIDVVEIPLDMPEALSVISTLVERFDDKVLVGAGSVLDAESASTAIAAGASFVTSPSCARGSARDRRDRRIRDRLQRWSRSRRRSFRARGRAVRRCRR